MSLSLSPNSLYRQTTDCTEGGGLTREHCTLSENITSFYNRGGTGQRNSLFCLFLKVVLICIFVHIFIFADNVRILSIYSTDKLKSLMQIRNCSGINLSKMFIYGVYINDIDFD